MDGLKRCSQLSLVFSIAQNRNEFSTRKTQALEMDKRIGEYLSNLPSKLITTANVEALIQKLRAFPIVDGQPGFKPTELLNIANLRPTSLVVQIQVLNQWTGSDTEHLIG